MTWSAINGVDARKLRYSYGLPSQLIYPLIATVVGAPQMISQSVSSIFPCSPLPSGTWRTPGLSIPWCCLPTSSSVCLVFFPLSLYLARWFWPDLMNGRHDHTLQFSSLYASKKVFVWSDFLLYFGTDFLVGNMVFVCVVSQGLRPTGYMSQRKKCLPSPSVYSLQKENKKPFSYTQEPTIQNVEGQKRPAKKWSHPWERFSRSTRSAQSWWASWHQ